MPSDERRASPRYPVDTRLFASIDGHTVLLRNISRDGVAIQAHGLAGGSAHLLEINIDHRHLTLAVEILDSSAGGLLHARFVNPAPDLLTLLDSYIEASA